MKHLLLTTIAAVLLVGCATTKHREPTTAKASDISIHDAVFAGNIEAVKQHIAAGTDVNAKDKKKVTPLHLAAFRGSRGHKEIAQLLIAAGADVNAKDFEGATPLDVAIGRESAEIADLLSKHGGKTGEELKAEEK